MTMCCVLVLCTIGLVSTKKVCLWHKPAQDDTESDYIELINDSCPEVAHYCPWLDWSVKSTNVNLYNRTSAHHSTVNTLAI